MSKNFLKVVLFSLFLIGLYTLYSTVVIPPITPEEPPKEAAVTENPKTAEEMVALGESVYNGKGACGLCHSAVGGRAPMLDKAAVTAADRIKDPRYKGKATDAASYLYESMTEPSAYVVPGYGVAGTNDTVSPMPDVRSKAIDLNDVEIKSVIAYLQSIAGVDVTVAPDLIPAKPDGKKK